MALLQQVDGRGEKCGYGAPPAESCLGCPSTDKVPRNVVGQHQDRRLAVAHEIARHGVDEIGATTTVHYENFTCGAEGNYDRYCNPELDKMVDRQSMEFDQKKRREFVWAIERKLAEDAARPILWHNRTGTCWQPYVKGYSLMVNSVYNGWRMEDVWLDK